MENARNPTAVRGSWNGQLIDIGGREGQISFTLQGNEGAVAGVFDALIAGQHHPIRIHGVVTGKIARKAIYLKLDSNAKESQVAVQYEGCLRQGPNGGWSTCGRYGVSSRRAAALIGGVMSARQVVAPRKGENVARRDVTAMPGAAQPTRAAPRARRAKSSRKAGRKS